MGMSSSQARLLNLTARMHQIEYKAAKLEAQKLQMANESSKVYQEYLNALDATKIQYSSLTSDGTITYIDATLNALENGLVSSYTGETSNTVLFLQDQDGKILVTPAIAEEYNLTESGDLGTLDEYLYSKGYLKSSKATYNVYEYQSVLNGSLSIEETSSPSYSPVSCTTASITESDLTSYIDGRTITISTADDLVALSTLAASYSTFRSYDYILTDDIDLTGYDWTSISSYSGTFDGNGYTISGLTDALFTTLSGATVTNLGLEGDITTTGSAGMLADKAVDSNITNVSASGSVTTSDADQAGGLIGYLKNSTVSYCSAAVNVNGSGSTADVGGLIGQANGTNTIEYCTASGDVSGGTYASGGLIGYLSGGNTVSNCSASGDVTGSSTLYSNADSQALGGLIGVVSYSSSYSGNTTIKNCSSTGDVTTNCSDAHTGSFIGNLYAYGSTSGYYTYLTDYYCEGSSDDEVDYNEESSFSSYVTVEATSASSSSTSSDAGATLSTTTELDDVISSEYSVSGATTASAVYAAIKSGNYMLDTDSALRSMLEGHEDDTEWLTTMINEGYLYIYVTNSDGELEQTSVSTDTGLQEVSDETALKKAEAQYEADMKKIDLKDTKYDTELAAIETEREAIESEIDTLKTVASDNVERTFKLFS